MGETHLYLASILDVCHFQTLSEVLPLSQTFQRKLTKAEWKYRAQAFCFSMSHFT